jgi:hypothetical protein
MLLGLLFELVQHINFTDMEKSTGTSRWRFQTLQWMALDQLLGYVFGSHRFF